MKKDRVDDEENEADEEEEEAQDVPYEVSTFSSLLLRDEHSLFVTPILLSIPWLASPIDTPLIIRCSALSDRSTLVVQRVVKAIENSLRRVYHAQLLDSLRGDAMPLLDDLDVVFFVRDALLLLSSAHLTHNHRVSIHFAHPNARKHWDGQLYRVCGGSVLTVPPASKGPVREWLWYLQRSTLSPSLSIFLPLSFSSFLFPFPLPFRFLLHTVSSSYS